jgi:hypothetical protein
MFGVLMEGQPGDNFDWFVLVVRLDFLTFCYSQTVFTVLIPEIYQTFMEQP